MADGSIRRQLRWELKALREKHIEFSGKLERHLRSSKPNLSKIISDAIDQQAYLEAFTFQVNGLMEKASIEKSDPGVKIGELKISPIEFKPARSFKLLAEQGEDEHEPYYPSSSIKTCGKLPCQCKLCGAEEPDIGKADDK